MKILIKSTAQETGQQAAQEGAELIKAAITARGEARIILATGASQLAMLTELVSRSDIDWAKCHIFHLDEYLGLADTHGASFVNYLRSRVVDKLNGVGRFVAIDGMTKDVSQELEHLSREVKAAPIDVAFIGIGVNAHLAFNDPPADFLTKNAYITVNLDQTCREQQVSEGWFENLNQVPKQAISMTIGQILAAQAIICTVPDQRKASAVQRAVEGPITPLCPASALQEHRYTTLFLDQAAAANLQGLNNHG